MLWQPDQLIRDRYQLLALKRDRPGHQVWLAWDQQSQTKVIIKTLAFTGEIQWDDVQGFEREVEVLRRLQHPRIPSFVDAFSLEEPYFCKCLVEEYIHAPSLQSFLERKTKIPTPQVWAIASQVLDILKDLHSLRPTLLHCNIKPSNILIDADKTLYLIDLRTVGIQLKTSDPTEAPTNVGSHGYTPIEQLMGQAVPASDLYALAATVIQLLTQTHPADLMNASLRLTLPPELDLAVPLKQWLYQLTAPQVGDRIPSAEQAKAALERAQQQTQQILQASEQSRSQVPQTPDTDAVIIRANWNEQTMAMKDVVLLTSFTLVPLLFGVVGSIATLSRTQGFGLLGTELLVLMMSLVPTGIILSKLFWNLVSQSVIRSASGLQIQWKIFTVKVRQTTIPVSDISSLTIKADSTKSWHLLGLSQTPSPAFICRLQPTDVDNVYRRLEHWLL